MAKQVKVVARKEIIDLLTIIIHDDPVINAVLEHGEVCQVDSANSGGLRPRRCYRRVELLIELPTAHFSVPVRRGASFLSAC